MESADEDGRWSAVPLPRGRHKVPRDEVHSSQKQRLLRAMTELVYEKGFEATTVPEVIKLAKVSGRTFYEIFDDKADCFIASCEQEGESLLAALQPDQAEIGSPLEALDSLDRGISTYLRWWAERPAGARAYFLELGVAGERGLELRARLSREFEVLFRTIAAAGRTFAQDGEVEVREIDFRSASILARELVAEEVRAGRLEQIEELHRDLRRVLLKILVNETVADLTERYRDAEEARD